LLNTTGQVVAQARRVGEEVKKGVKISADVIDQLRLDALKTELETMIPLVKQVMHQTKARVFKNDLHVLNKLVSLFEPATQKSRSRDFCVDGTSNALPALEPFAPYLRIALAPLRSS